MVRSGAPGGVAEVLHGGGEAEAAGENPFVAFDGEIVLVRRRSWRLRPPLWLGPPWAIEGHSD